MRNILIACEFSGIVRDAFILKGFNAISCDLLPTEKPGPHYQGNVLDIINDGFDLMIAHPPCTALTSSGQWYYKQFPDLVNDAATFFISLATCNIEKICIENPTGVMTKRFRKPDQIIHPYYFGEPHMKRTALWLKNLPLLTHPDKNQLAKPDPIYIDKSGTKRFFTDAISGDRNGGHLRSRTFQSIASAMAEQWSKLFL